MATSEIEDFAALLRELKDRSGRSYGSLAAKLHLSNSTLHRYCNGDAVPTEFTPIGRFARLCEATREETVELHRRWIIADGARRRSRSTPATRPTAGGDGEAPRPAEPHDPGPATTEPAPSGATPPEPPATGPLPGRPAGGGATGGPTTDRPTGSGHTTAGPAAGEGAPGKGSGGPGAPAPASRRGRRRLPLAAVTAVAALAASGGLLVSGQPDTHPSLTDATAADHDGSAPHPSASAGEKGSATPTADATEQPSTTGSPSARRTGGGRSAGAITGHAADGGPPAVTIRSYDWDEPCGKYYLLDKDPAKVPPPPSVQDRRNWARTLGGVDAGSMKLELAVQGRSSAAVVLTALHVRVVGSSAPLAWSAYDMGEGCGGGLTPAFFDINLDSGQPVLRPTAGSQGDRTIPATDFPYRVSSSDPQVIDVDAHVSGHDVRWYLELDWSSGDQHGTVRVDDGGKPFRTSAQKGRPTYLYDSTKWQPDTDD